MPETVTKSGSDSPRSESTGQTGPDRTESGTPGPSTSQVTAPSLTLPTTPELATALRDVWGAGGWPLAALFVVALIGVILVGAGVVEQATATILNLALFLAVASFLTFLVLTILGFLRWKAELTAHQEMFRADTELQDRFILQLVQYATTVGGSAATPADRKRDIETLAGAVGDLIRAVTGARNQLRQLPQPAKRANTEEIAF